MRTGAIFARGSCRALRWMALAGMVFALGAGSAAAQAKPNKPVLTVKGKAAQEVTLVWTVPAGGPTITGFVTHDGTSPITPAFAAATERGEVITDGTSATRMTDIDGLTERVRHTFRVGALGAGDADTADITWSDPVDFTTETEEAPPVPATFTVATGDKQATLTWTPGTGGGAVRYYERNFKLGVAPADFTTPAEIKKWTRVPGGSGARSVIIPSLMNGRSYVFGIRAVNNGGATPAADRDDGIPSGKPGAPTELTATPGTPAAGKVKVTLAWMEPEDNGNTITGYEYEIVDADSTVVKAWTLTGDSNTFFVTAALDAAKEAGYTYRVRAVNDNGVGAIASTDPTDTTGTPRLPRVPRVPRVPRTA